MNIRNKGLAFILNNNNFDDKTMTSARKGSEIDVENAEHVFKEIGYTTVVKQDLKAHVSIIFLHLRPQAEHAHNSGGLKVSGFMTHIIYRA